MSKPVQPESPPRTGFYINPLPIMEPSSDPKDYAPRNPFENRPNGCRPRIGDLLAKLCPDGPVVLSEAELAQYAGLTEADLAELRRPLPHPSEATKVKNHWYHDDSIMEYAWTRSYAGTAPGVDFALCKRSQDDRHCYLMDIPEDLREQAWEAVQSPVTWQAFIEALPNSVFKTWHPSIFAGLEALMAIDMTCQSNTKITEALALHLRLAARELWAAAGLVEALPHTFDNPREGKLYGLIDSLNADVRRNHALSTHHAAANLGAPEPPRDRPVSVTAHRARKTGKGH